MAEAPEIRFLGDLQRLELGPDDRFVLTIDRPIDLNVRDRILDVWKGFWGKDVPLLVLDAGMKLGAFNVHVAPAKDA